LPRKHRKCFSIRLRRPKGRAIALVTARRWKRFRRPLWFPQKPWASRKRPARSNLANADLVILGADPLENISNIRRTDKVVQGGVIYDCAALWRSVGFQP